MQTHRLAFLIWAGVWVLAFASGPEIQNAPTHCKCRRKRNRKIQNKKRRNGEVRGIWRQRDLQGAEMQIDNITSERGDLAWGQRSEGFDQIEGKVTERKSNYDCGAISGCICSNIVFSTCFRRQDGAWKVSLPSKPWDPWAIRSFSIQGNTP